jgi:hypothetical protein
MHPRRTFSHPADRSFDRRRSYDADLLYQSSMPMSFLIGMTEELTVAT